MLTGFRAWVVQRFSAVYLAFYFLIAPLTIVSQVSNYDDWVAFFYQPIFFITTLVAYAMILLHAWVGVRDITLDYARNTFWRVLFLSVWGLVLLLQLAWVLWIFFKL